MSEKKLVIQARKYGGESKVISMRLPEEMLAEIDKTSAKSGRTRNEILVLCLEYALENMQVE